MAFRKGKAVLPNNFQAHSLENQNNILGFIQIKEEV
jgi:hypothetical protein